MCLAIRQNDGLINSNKGNYLYWAHYPDYFTNWGDTIIIIYLLLTLILHIVHTYCKACFEYFV